MAANRWSKYFERHKSQLQAAWFYQVCGVASQLLYGIGDAVIVFFMDKYLIMKRHPENDG